MKKSLFSLFFFGFGWYALFAQNFDFNAKWKEIEKNEQQNLFKRNLSLVEQILIAAHRQNQTEHLVRALVYKSSILFNTLEDKQEPEVKIIQDFHEHIQKQTGVNKLILKAYLAKFFNDYRNSRHNENENTTTSTLPADFREWNDEQFDSQIQQLYDEIFAEKDVLFSKKSSDFKVLIAKLKPYNEELQPTLFDIMVNEYSEYFSNSYEFSDERKTQAQEFLLNLYRTAANFHEKTSPNAYLFNKEQALQQMLSLGKLSDNDFELWVDESRSKFSGVDFMSQVLFNKAQRLNNSGNKKDAMQLAKQIVRDFPKSPWTKNAEQLIQSLNKPEIEIKTETYSPPQQSLPLFITHTNTNKIYIRLYHLKSQHINALNEWMSYFNQDNVEKYLSHFNLVRNDEINLKYFDDFKPHKTLWSLDNLQKGNYILFYSDGKNFNWKTDIVKSLKFTVTDILPLVDYKTSNFGDNFYLANRQTGFPCSNEQIEIFVSGDENNLIKSLGKFTSDAVGKVSLSSTLFKGFRYSSLYLRPVKSGEIINLSYLYEGYEEPAIEPLSNVKVLTDRSIYRPGQTIYFKVIAYEENPEKFEEIRPVRNKKIKVTLENPNYQMVSEQELITNEFGSAHGSFVLPTGGLTGTFQIKAGISMREYGSQSFSVEEYKRPKFEVKFEDIKETFALDKEVILKGKATSFSGASLSNAKGTYRVQRIPIRRFWRWESLTNEKEEEIAAGDLLVNSDGTFEVKFVAATREKRGKYPRTFSYRVEVSVTDVNGETQSATTQLRLSDVPVQLSLAVSDEYELGQWKEVGISTQNLQGTKISTDVTLQIDALIVPKKLYRPSQNLFNEVEYHLLSKKEFEQKFPLDAYDKEENQPEKFSVQRTVLNRKVNSGQTQEVDVSSLKLPVGMYRISAFTMYDKDTIREERFVKITNPETQAYGQPRFFFSKSDITNKKIGQNATIHFYSDVPDAKLWILVEKSGKKEAFQQLDFKNGKAVWIYPVNFNPNEPVFVHYMLVRYNRFISTYEKITLKEPEKEAEVITKVFRNKLEPGAPETWEFQIKGKEGNFISEVLATMYDASLDQFQPHSLSFVPKFERYFYPKISSLSNLYSFFASSYSETHSRNYFYPDFIFPQLNYLNRFGFYFGQSRRIMYPYAKMVEADGIAEMAALPPPGETQREKNGASSEGLKKESSATSNTGQTIYVIDGIIATEKDFKKLSTIEIESVTILDGTTATSIYGEKAKNGAVVVVTKKNAQSLKKVKARTQLQETAFWFPQLMTDSEGNVSIKFNSPEALTRWKFSLVAHSKAMNYANFQGFTQTKKDLMVFPNPPRFLREGDEVIFQTKITNLTNASMGGTAQLLLFDAFTMQPVDADFQHVNKVQSFQANANADAVVSWTLKVPLKYQAIVYRIVAQSGKFSDGEENSLPILTNRALITETLPLYIRENQNKSFELKNLSQNTSSTLQNFKLTLEMTTEPIWLALFALPYLREYPYECTEQIFARLYGNMISFYILNKYPKIKRVFEEWQSKGELKSDLEKNETLKSILLEETPWLRNAQSETDQMQRIALFFDLNTMANEFKQTKDKLFARQKTSGGFPWFEGGYEDIFITQHIVSGLGKLRKTLGENEFWKIFGSKDGEKFIQNALKYLDSKNKADWDLYKKNPKRYSYSAYQGAYYLYARSFWRDKLQVPSWSMVMKKELIDKTKVKEIGELQTLAMFALVHQRYGTPNLAKSIVTYLDETSVDSDEMGKYWKKNTPGWEWWRSPIETQAMLIECFDEVSKNLDAVESMKVWLLKHRQTNRWNTTKATTEAVYALMNFGKSWVSSSNSGLSVTVGNDLVYPSNQLKDAEGTGFFKISWNAEQINSEKGKVQLSKTTPGVAWGGLYWQYFEQLDKVIPHATEVTIQKELFIKTLNEKGPILQPISEDTRIKVGDVVTVRIVINTNRGMNYIHLKDYRAAGFEPVDVLSGYKWKNGLGYYESIRDAATNFFIDYLPKGVFVFEYDVKANNAGVFSNGYTLLQNMYAPEMSSKSAGSKVSIQ